MDIIFNLQSTNRLSTLIALRCAIFADFIVGFLKDGSCWGKLLLKFCNI
jgi:hypothetical protein